VVAVLHEVAVVADLVVAELVLVAALHEVAAGAELVLVTSATSPTSPTWLTSTTRGGERLGVRCSPSCTRWRWSRTSWAPSSGCCHRRRYPARGERLVVVTSPSAPSCGTREVAVVADRVVAELVVAALHEVR
jgi:hypothetical protein